MNHVSGMVKAIHLCQMNYTLSILKLCKWGHFDRANHIFKMLQVSLAENMLTTRSRSFQRGTVGSVGQIAKLQAVKVEV